MVHGPLVRRKYSFEAMYFHLDIASIFADNALVFLAMERKMPISESSESKVIKHEILRIIKQVLYH